eukprot:TRINITY_DN3838_c0_g2_i1.p1 TRINITY_DN3838_c0_g2~~TRINITY_DN3838_c0_g2_i1.p1  ORF type:complete len:132 (+),score=27.16 TRINITY_DN3838_c0_g2_i1:132-527(+)
MGRVIMHNGDLNANCQWGSIEIQDVVGGNVNAYTNYGALSVVVDPTSFQGSFNLQSQSGMINIKNFGGSLTTDLMQRKSGSWGTNNSTENVATFSVNLSSDSGEIDLAFDKEIDFEAKHRSWRKNWNQKNF